MLLDNVATFERILDNVRQWRKYEQDEELAHTMEDAIQKTKHEIAEIRKQQRVQFEAYLAVNETVSGSEMPTIAEEQEVSLKLGGTFGKGNKREELWPYTEEPHQSSHNQIKTAHDPGNTPQMEEEQVDKQCEQADTVSIPHRRVEALRSPASRQAKPSASQARLQQEAWSINESPRQLGRQAYMSAWMSAATIDRLLRENVEKQGALLAGLKRCKEEILKMQEEIEREGGLEEQVLQQWRMDVEAFLREREVMDRRG